jgi:hypothetical protein
MNVLPTPSPIAAFVQLWRRALLWRMCVLLALGLTTLFILCPPDFGTGSDRRALPEQVAYVAPKASPVAAPSIPATPPAAPPVVAKESQPALAATVPPALRRGAALRPAPAANAAISLAVPGQAQAADSSGLDPALLGRTYSGSIDVNGFHLPLPAGKWAVLANIRVGKTDAPGLGLFLGHIEHRRLVAGLRVFALKSVDLPGRGFPSVQGCVPGNPRYNAMDVAAMTPFGHQACWLISNLYTPPYLQWADRAVKIAQLDRIAAGDMAAKGVTYPQDLMSVEFYRAEKWGLVQADYLFSPDSEGIRSSDVVSYTDSDWYPSKIGRFPEKMAYIEKLKSWAQTSWPKFDAAFDAAQPSGYDAAVAANPSAAASEQPLSRSRPAPLTDDTLQTRGQECRTAPRHPVRSAVAGATEAQPSRGLSCFFDGTGQLYAVRMVMPYSGEVDGVHLGDSFDSVRAKLGEATKQFAFRDRQAKVYVRPAGAFERFDVGAGTVQVMYVGKTTQ